MTQGFVRGDRKKSRTCLFQSRRLLNYYNIDRDFVLFYRPTGSDIFRLKKL